MRGHKCQDHPKALFELFPTREDTSEIAIRIVPATRAGIYLLYFYTEVLRYMYTQYTIIQHIQVSQIRTQARSSFAPYAWDLI